MNIDKEIPETNLCLDDIRNKLNDLEDKVLALDILSNLSKVENQLADKTAIITKMTLRENELLTQNNELFSRVTQNNGKENPSSNVDYTNIDRNLSDVINDI